MRYLSSDASHQFQPNSSYLMSLYFNAARSNIPRTLGCNNKLEATRQLEMHLCIEVFALFSFNLSLNHHLATHEYAVSFKDLSPRPSILQYIHGPLARLQLKVENVINGYLSSSKKFNTKFWAMLSPASTSNRMLLFSQCWMC